jgi:hypothetical protein
MNDDQHRRYLAATHAVQSGVAATLHRDPRGGTPKHLRVGIDTAKAEHAALVRLLIAKGLFTEAEYIEAIIAGVEAEKAAYEERLSAIYGMKITLI